MRLNVLSSHAQHNDVATKSYSIAYLRTMASDVPVKMHPFERAIEVMANSWPVTTYLHPPESVSQQRTWTGRMSHSN